MVSSVMLVTLNVTPLLLHLIFQRLDKFYFLNTSVIKKNTRCNLQRDAICISICSFNFEETASL